MPRPKRPTPAHRLSLHIDPVVDAALRMRAARERRPLSAIVEDALRASLWGKPSDG